MAARQTKMVIQHLCTVVEPDRADVTDGELLDRFLKQRDDDALALLVRRHSSMVWGVCRRLLHSHHDAEDAFQATFLVLVSKAESIVPREMVANWLHGVAYQTAVRLRSTAAKRAVRERQVVDMPEPVVAEARAADLLPLIDHELSFLPQQLRILIVLCDLEGKSRKEVAQQLAIPEGTVASRLARARVVMAKRLARHGFAVSGGGLAAVLSESEVSATVPSFLLSSTIQAVRFYAVGKAATTEAISIRVVTLTERVVKAMLFNKLKLALAVVLILGFVATGAIILTSRIAAGQQEKPPIAENSVKASEKPESVRHEPPSKKPEITTGMKLTLSADEPETFMYTGAAYGAFPVKLKLTFTNDSDKPIKIDAYALPYRIQFRCDGPGLDSVKKHLELIDMAFKPPTEEDYPVLQPGKSWSPSWDAKLGRFHSRATYRMGTAHPSATTCASRGSTSCA